MSEGADYCTVIGVSDDYYCNDCGWPVVKVCCNGKFKEFKDADKWDWWEYCSNKGCKNHEGEGVFQSSPDWRLKSMSSTVLYVIIFLLGAIANSLWEYYVLGISKNDNRVVRVVPVAKQDDNIILFINSSDKYYSKDELFELVEKVGVDCEWSHLPVKDGDKWVIIDSSNLDEVEGSVELTKVENILNA